MANAAAPFLFAALAALSPRPGEEVDFTRHETRSYAIYVDKACVDAERKSREWGAMLEQARASFRKFFRAQARPAATARFVVRVLPDIETWKARILDEGGSLPAKVDRVWYRQDNEHVYVVEQSEEYWTRGQILYGTCQQYFGAVAPERRHLLFGWYLHGIASSFALHRWNGEDGEFGIVPWVTDSGMPEDALANLDPSQVALDRFNVEELDTPASWGVVTFLLKGASGKVRKRFEKLALGTTGSAVSSTDLAHAFGGTLGELQADLHRWLQANQPPFELASGWWEDIGGRELRARVGTGEMGFCLLRAAPEWLEVDLDIPFNSRVGAGIVLGHRDATHFAVAKVQDSYLTVRLHEGRDQETLATLPIDARRGDSYPLRIVRSDDGIAIRAGRVEAGPFEMPAGRLGLIVENGAAGFRNLAWK